MGGLFEKIKNYHELAVAHCNRALNWYRCSPVFCERQPDKGDINAAQSAKFRSGERF